MICTFVYHCSLAQFGWLFLFYYQFKGWSCWLSVDVTHALLWWKFILLPHFVWLCGFCMMDHREVYHLTAELRLINGGLVLFLSGGCRTLFYKWRRYAEHPYVLAAWSKQNYLRIYLLSWSIREKKKLWIKLNHSFFMFGIKQEQDVFLMIWTFCCWDCLAGGWAAGTKTNVLTPFCQSRNAFFFSPWGKCVKSARKKIYLLSKVLAPSQFFIFIWASPLGFIPFSSPHCRLMDSRVFGWHRGSGTVSQPSFVCSFYPLALLPPPQSIHQPIYLSVCMPFRSPHSRQWKRWSLSDEGFLLSNCLCQPSCLCDNSHWFHKQGGGSKKERI